MAYLRRRDSNDEVKTAMTVTSLQCSSQFPHTPFEDFQLPTPNPMTLYPVIKTLGNYLPYKSIREFQSLCTTWADALRPQFFDKSKLRVDMSTPLRQTQTLSVMRDDEDPDPVDMVVYAFNIQETEAKVKTVMEDLQRVYPLPSKEDSTSEHSDVFSVPQIKNLEIITTKLDTEKMVEHLVPWLKVYGRSVRTLKLLKSPIQDDIEVLEGAKSLCIVPKVFESILETLPSLEELELHGISRASTEMHLVYSSPTHAEEALDTRRSNREEPPIEISETFKSFPSVKTLKIHHCSEFCPYNMTVDLIKMFPSLRSLSMRFFDYGHPLQSMKSFAASQTLENITHLELTSDNDYPEMVGVESLEHLSLMRFSRLKSFTVDPISVEDDHTIQGATYLLIFLQNTSETLETLKIRWTSSHIFWDNGRIFLERLFLGMPLMPKLKSFDATMDCAYSTVPLLVVLNSFPNLQNFSLTPNFFPTPGGGKNTPVTVHLLPKEDQTVHETVTALSLNGLGFRIAESCMQRLSRNFPNVESLSLVVLSGRGYKGLDKQLEYIYELKCLRNLTVVCKGLTQVMFDTCMNLVLGLSLCDDTKGLKSFKIVNADYSSMFRKIQLYLYGIQYFIQRSPFLEYLEFDGFDGITLEDMKFLKGMCGKNYRKITLTVKTQDFPILVAGNRISTIQDDEHEE